MANVKQIKINNTVYDVEDSVARRALEQKAPLESPALTGIPTAPTASNGTSTTQIATTAFVQNAVQGAGGGYTLPVASSTTLGGVKPVAKTASMTQEVGVDASGALYTEPGSGGGGSTDISLGIIGAAAGKIPKIKAVDAEGKPTAWAPVDMGGGGVEWYEVIDTETTEAVNDLIISTDKNGRPISGYHALAMVLCFMIPEDSTQTSTNGSIWVYPMSTNDISSGLRIIQTVTTWKTTKRFFNYLYAGSNHAMFMSGSNAANVFDGSYNDVFNGVRLYVNTAGDHLPVGTNIRCLVLSKGWEA